MEGKNMRKPIFVYGTLRNGFGNYSRILRGRTTKEVDAEIRGFDMYAVGDAFPAVARGKGVVYGELMYPAEEHYKEVLADLDMLEGYRPRAPKDSMYIRETVLAVDESGQEVEAEVYIWNRPKPPRKIEHGDWRTFKIGAF